jgi:predicted nucleic acid-binding protein
LETHNLLKDLQSKEASLAIEDLTKLYDDLAIISTRELKDQAMHIAISQNITVYDALFVAAAQKLNAALSVKFVEVSLKGFGDSKFIFRQFSLAP